MPKYLTAAEYPAVRAAIDVSLDASNLPDAVIALPMYADDAERWVVEQNPLAPTYTAGSDEFLKTQVAAIYACAALILPAVPNLTSESFSQAERYTREAIDVTAMQATLWARARSAIRGVLVVEPDTTIRPPVRFLFTTAKGRRGLGGLL